MRGAFLLHHQAGRCGIDDRAHVDTLTSDVAHDATAEAVRAHAPNPDRLDTQTREPDRDVAVRAARADAGPADVGEIAELGGAEQPHGLAEGQDVAAHRVAAIACRHSASMVEKSPAAIDARGTIQLPPIAITEGRAR